jgi:hypothetical protein
MFTERERLTPPPERTEEPKLVITHEVARLPLKVLQREPRPQLKRSCLMPSFL